MPRQKTEVPHRGILGTGIECGPLLMTPAFFLMGCCILGTAAQISSGTPVIRPETSQAIQEHLIQLSQLWQQVTNGIDQFAQLPH